MDAPVEIEYVVESTALSTGAIVGIVIFAVVSYVYFAYCTNRIAKKLGVEPAWTAWIPIANLWLMAKMAGYGGGWFLLFLVPFANIVMVVIVWMKIARFLGKTDTDIVYGLLMLIPLVNYLMIGIPAFSESARVQAPPAA